MIQLRKKDDSSFYLEYIGELDAKHNILRILASSSNKKRVDTNNWIIDNKTKNI